MFKLDASKKALAEATIHVVYDGKDTGATITVAGPEHERSRAAAQDYDRRRRAYRKRTGGDLTDNPDELLALTVDMLTARTLAWSGFASDDGAPMPFNEANVRKAYTDYRWLRSQVLSAMGDEENFTRPSAASSSITPGPGSA